MFEVMSLKAVLAVFLTAIALHSGLVLVTRFAGVRSFSKLSAFDFAITVAIGSVLASTLVSDKPPLTSGLVAIIALFSVQISAAILRHRFPAFENLVDNKPRLIMWEGAILPRQLKAAKVTRDDLRAKLREANVIQLSEVRAVVAETTGDVSVLHTTQAGTPLETSLLNGVLGFPVDEGEREDFG